MLAACTTLRTGLADVAVPAATPDGAHATLTVLETTDLHANVLGYDYYKLAPDASFGLERTATLITQARAEFPNTLLLDNGDTLHGSVLADYQGQVHPIACSETPAIYKGMNWLGYDAGTVGNHDFDYGLPFMRQVMGARGAGIAAPGQAAARCGGAAFPIVLANVTSIATGQPLFAPYAIINKPIKAVRADGSPYEASVKVGILGLTTPMIMNWNRQLLEGKVTARGIVETARHYLPLMRAAGAEVIIVLSHGGLSDAPYTPDMEDGNWHLAQVPGIDALLMGHMHSAFPNPAGSAPLYGLPGVDKVKGTVFGVPAVMAGQWGKHLGVLGLALRRDGGRWTVDRAASTAQVRAVQPPGQAAVAADPAIAPLVQTEHAAAIAYVKAPVGSTEFRMSSYFADVGDPSAIQVVNQAQAAYLADYVHANLPQYAGLPVLSVSAPFKSGTAGAGDYTDVKAGPLALNNAADLYLYQNALAGVKVTGAGLQAWLEKAAERFHTIDPTITTPQELINTGVYGFNFDIVTDSALQYRIDVTQPPGKRVSGLAYQGKPVGPEQQFLVATNSYRASGGGNFPGLDGGKTILAAPEASRDVLIAYIRRVGALTRATNGAASSWRFAPANVAGPVVFHAPPGLQELAREAGLEQVSQLQADDGGGKKLALYGVDLSR